MAFSFSVGSGHGEKSSLRKTLLKHFGVAAGEVATAGRQFPISARVDIQSAVSEVLRAYPNNKILGLLSQNPHEPLAIAQVISAVHSFVAAGPLQYDEIDIGEPDPVRCLKNALWLSSTKTLPFAVMIAAGGRFGLNSGVQVEIGVPVGEEGSQFSQEFFRALEVLVSKGETYRGRVISLEGQIDPFGGGSMIKVHRLGTVQRDEVILPDKTLALLDRNVSGFTAVREKLRVLQFQTRKGLLFYGPPGTGKTHTIHYLISQLAGHTTLIVTAEQVALLSEYFKLARFLQPSIMIIEDVDLIARERTHMHYPGQESLLNKLLNEMDGLREDADVLFILTTNRPEEIEPALASRPGRIDQAIEFPLPDEEGRAKLVSLYSRGLAVSNELATLIVARTKGVSAAFIKELMRRCAQFEAEKAESQTLTQSSVDQAIEEMLFSGGSLNRRLLGGEEAGPRPN